MYLPELAQGSHPRPSSCKSTLQKCKKVQKQRKFLEGGGSEAGVPVRRCQPGSRGSPGVCDRHRTTYYWLLQCQSKLQRNYMHQDKHQHDHYKHQVQAKSKFCSTIRTCALISLKAPHHHCLTITKGDQKSTQGFQAVVSSMITDFIPSRVQKQTF